MAKVILTPERITKLVEMVENPDIFVVFHGECQITSAVYSKRDISTISENAKHVFDFCEADTPPYTYYGGEVIDIRIFRRDDAVIF